jgi:predicted Na+-dependent transporter
VILCFIGFKISKLLGKEPKSGALSVGRRNLSLAYMVAFALNEPLIALPAVFWALTQNLLPSILILNYRSFLSLE